MEIREITAALRSLGESAPSRGEDCMAPESLASYHGGAMGPDEAASVEEHLANCDFCLGQVAVMSLSHQNSTEDDASMGVAPSLMVRAEGLFAASRQRTRPAVFRWATAAVLALAVGLAALPFVQTPELGVNDPQRQTRYAEEHVLRPQLLAPQDGSVIRPDEQRFLWTEVPGALFYDVRLVNADGDLLLRERLEKTQWLIHDHLSLERGEEYFFRVDAYLSDAKYLSSGHFVFRVADGD